MEMLSVITLPEEEKRKNALENKLEEYKERLDKKKERGFYIHPASFNRLNSHSLYKYDILKKLLEEGEVDLEEFSVEIRKKYNFFDSDDYEDASLIISDYCNTGGKNLHGGTGLQG